MSPTRLEHGDVEALLTRTLVGREDLADLEKFLAVISGEPSPPRDVQQMGSALAATARSSRRSAGRGVRRLATLAAAGAILLATSGIALAANGSSPGDSLYGLDRALERVGLGAGGVEERVIEFDALMARGSDGDAFVFMAEVIEAAPGPDAQVGLRHLELAIADSGDSPSEAQEKVAALHIFIAENLGPGFGLDGKEFGQAVAEIARTDLEPSTEETPETPQNQGSDNAASAPRNEGSAPGSGGQSSSPPDTTSGSQPEDPGSQSNQPESPPGQSESPPGRSDQGQSGGQGPPADSASQDTSGDDSGSGDTSGPGNSSGSNQGGGQGGGSSNSENGNGNSRP